MRIRSHQKELGPGANFRLLWSCMGLRLRLIHAPHVRCSSSVVEHSLGKGEVGSSILPCSTIFSLKTNVSKIIFGRLGENFVRLPLGNSLVAPLFDQDKEFHID